MTAGYENSALELSLPDWSPDRIPSGNSRLESLRVRARRRLIQAAVDYRQRLTAIGDRAGLLKQSASLLSGDPDVGPIVMTGHQPVIFHSGLTFKYEMTEQFAASREATAVSIVIDTDEGDAGAFSFPEAKAVRADDGASGPTLSIASATFGRAPSLYGTSRMKSSAEILAEASRVSHGLASCGCTSASATFQQVAGQYASINTDSMMEANLIIRWNAGIGSRIPELPLSVVSGFPEVIQFFSDILQKPFEFVRCYNSTLTAFRSEQKIRNEANPFPNLQCDSTSCEMPFWIVDGKAGTRHAVMIRKQESDYILETSEGLQVEIVPGNESASVFSLLISGKQLVPRGAMITATFRLLFSDLFVHGTGGARYDRYTDSLIRTWWKVEPTPFGVASASRYLFEKQRQELSHLQSISDQLRDLQFNPQRHLGAGLFSPETEDFLRDRLAAKEEAVADLRQARDSGQSAQEIGRVIQQVGDEIKSRVLSDFEPQLVSLRAIPAETMAVWNCRTWPWMFF